MPRDDWVISPRFGAPFRVIRWTDLNGGEPFQESRSAAAVEGILDALARNEGVASSILADAYSQGWYAAPADGRLDERSWDVLRRAFGDGHYVLVAVHRPGGITGEELHAIMPRLPRRTAENYLPLLNTAMTEAHITTPLRRAAFLAQLAVESGELTLFEEIASGNEYEGRKDLGNTQPGDGRRFKGRGPIQITGRNTYRAAGRDLGLDLENDPQRVATPEVGFRTAAWFWTWKALNRLADSGNFDEITHRVNGGYTDKPRRDAYYRRAKAVLGAQGP